MPRITALTTVQSCNVTIYIMSVTNEEVSGVSEGGREREGKKEREWEREGSTKLPKKN